MKKWEELTWCKNYHNLIGFLLHVLDVKMTIQSTRLILYRFRRGDLNQKLN